MKSFLLAVCCLLISSGLFATSAGYPWYTIDSNNNVSLNVDLFISSSCIHCQKADAFFTDAEKKHPWINVHRYRVNEDKSALFFFNKRLKQEKDADFTVPAMFFCDSRWIGFDRVESMGSLLLKELNACRYQIQKNHQLPQTYINELRRQSLANRLSIQVKTIPLSTGLWVVILGLSDAFLPCSLCFILLALAWLTLANNKIILQLMIVIASLGTLLNVELLEKAQNYYLSNSLTSVNIIAIIIGILLISYAVFAYQSAKHDSPLKLLLAAAIISLVTVCFFQQMCQANIRLIFDQWLSAQRISSQAMLNYQGLYLLVNTIPALLLLGIYGALLHTHYLSKHRDFLTKIACIILIGIGLPLMIYPAALANFWYSVILLSAAILVAYLTKKRNADIGL